MSHEPFRILFVDDEIDVVKPLMEQVSTCGFEALCASDCESGFKIVEEYQDSLVLVFSDLKLESRNGLELRRRMLPKLEQIPYIIYSGFITEQTLLEAIDLKVTKFIEKPIEIEDLGKIIESTSQTRIEILHEKRCLRNIFIEEAAELLESLESEILDLEVDSRNIETVDKIFRIVHTIKGGSGVLDWPEFTKAVHAYEDLLSHAKSQPEVINSDFISLLLKGFDFLTAVLQELEKPSNNPINLAYWQDLFNTYEFQTTDLKKDSQSKQPKHRNDGSKDSDAIKIPTKTLDEFMELSGEITVIRNTVNKLVTNLQKDYPINPDIRLLAEFLEEMHKINSSMQAKITDLRKVPIKEVMKTFPRMIRDLNLELNKKINLEITGESLRIDTKLAQIFRASLVHLLRNSADHGIEQPDKRLLAGKPETGNIVIECQEKGDDILVEITDDGAGIDPRLIAAKAIEKQLVTSKQLANMSDCEILDLIMMPGFSTAASITNISGRGVGMDMVKSTVETNGGTIQISSQYGKGSKFRLKLPVPKSVLIIQSLRIACADRNFNIPQDNITRLTRFDQSKRDLYIESLEGKYVFRLDHRLIPLIHIREIFDESFQTAYNDDLINIIILKADHALFALAVDRIDDAEEIVVKKIGSHVAAKYILGATFMEDGKVGLILDINDIATRLKLRYESEPPRLELAVAQANVDTLEIISFKLPVEGLFCTALEDILRLEEISSASIQIVSGTRTIIYRDQVMPLYEVSQCIAKKANPSLWEQEKIATLVVRNGEQYYGLCVEEIIEIANISKRLTPCSSNLLHVLGSALFQSRVITVVDVYALLGLERKGLSEPNAELNPAVNTEEPVSHHAEAKSTEDFAAGWGLF